MLAKLFTRFWRDGDAHSRLAQQWVGRGLDALAAGDPGAARAAFESALAVDDGHLAATVNLGHVLREHFGDYVLAATHYRAALQRDPNLHNVRVQGLRGVGKPRVHLGGNVCDDRTIVGPAEVPAIEHRPKGHRRHSGDRAERGHTRQRPNERGRRQHPQVTGYTL